VLEGGWLHWRGEGREVSTSSSPLPSQVYPVAEGVDDFTISTDEILAASRENTALIIDTRTPEEYRGETNAVNGRAGRVPGAALVEVSKNVAPIPQGNFWRSLSELASAYDEVGAKPESEVIVYCQSGRRASLSYLTLRYLLGYSRVRWYDGSWKAWGASDLPVERG
jgi:thiosulfate/3-mercaptopyruvate sulfurtransferase